jgi:tetratricopeptide (TPR) repeat protein
MFDFVKKAIFKPKEKKEPLSEKIAEDLHKRSGELVDFIKNKVENAKEEFENIKLKYNNLEETNYKLGLKHLENGKLSEAIFRFRFIKKMWPTSYDAYYYLAYCLALTDKKLPEAREVLAELFAREPDYDEKATELLENINHRLEKPANE